MEEKLTFDELLGLKADEALGVPCCTYIELLDGCESRKKSNIVFSLQCHLLPQLLTGQSTSNALFLVKTDQSLMNNRVLVQLNSKFLESLSNYWMQHYKTRNALTELYNALYVGSYYNLRIDSEIKKVQSVKGLRDMFYIDTRPVEWFPIVKEPTEVERPDGSGETDLYSPDKTDAQVKQSKTKTLAMLAIAALSLLN